MGGALIFALATAAIAVLACLVWLRLAGALCGLLPGGGRALLPWVFLGPALLFIAVYLLWPMVATFGLSLDDGTGIGTGVYRALAADPRFRDAALTNLVWVLVVPAVATLAGLLAAGLAEGLRGQGIVQALVFLPGAISATGAAVIWKLVYDYRPAGQDQIGLLNALSVTAGGAPRPWLTVPGLNDALLMAVMVWVQAGFAMAILSVALGRIPAEVVNAAILDGARPWRLFLRIKLPQLRTTLAAVWVTITVIVLKVFDVVFVLTGGQWGTQVLSGLMFDRMFRAGDPAGAAAIAVVMTVLVAPFVLHALWRGCRAGRPVP